MASVVFCGRSDVPADDASWSPAFSLIRCFVDHYFGSGRGEGISVEVVVSEEAGVG